jgi:putative phosphotransacetylase
VEEKSMTEDDSQNKKIGQYLLEDNILQEDQISSILEIQERDKKAGVLSKFGEICVRMGLADASDINKSVINQSQSRVSTFNLLDILLILRFLDKGIIEKYELDKIENQENLEEYLIEQGLCDAQEVLIAKNLLILKRNDLIRQRLYSNFMPLNIMELLIVEQIDDVIKEDELCHCSQCWKDIFSIAANELPSLYVSEHIMLEAYLNRHRDEYGTKIHEKLIQARNKVRSNPKAACRAKLSDELLPDKVYKSNRLEVIVHVLNRHVYLTQKDVNILFGIDYKLKELKKLWQRGWFTAQETVTLSGPKGKIEGVRILGPAQKVSHAVISGADQFILGIKAPVRPPGKIEKTPGITISGPKGKIDLKQGLIRLKWHIHMSQEDAGNFKVKDGDGINVRLLADRAVICEDVLICVSDNAVLEMHINTDEANSAGLPPESTGQMLIRKAE